jgi:multiple sugar transport system substrate-binding protein
MRPKGETEAEGIMATGSFWRTGTLAALALAAGVAFAAQDAMAQTIRMWTFLDPASGKDPREKVLKTLIDQFEAANPGVKIVVEPQVWQQMTDKFFAAHQTGTAPDVMWVHLRRVPDAIKLGALANLDTLFVKNWSKEDIADIDGSFWRFGATPTAHYTIVHSRSTVGQFYRADLFKEAGIDPKSLTTWDKFIAAAQKLTVRDASGNTTRWGFGQAYAIDGANNSVGFSVMLDRTGKIFDDKNRAMWATPAGVEGLKLQTDMIRQYKITQPSAVSEKNDDLYDQFNAGRFAIIRGASARIPRAMQALGPDKVGFLPTPSFTEGKFSPAEVAGWAVSVWSKTKYPELAGKFVEFISSKQADKLWVTQAGAVPIRKSTIKDNAAFFADPKNAYLVDVAASMLDAGWFPPEGAGAGWNEELNRAAQDVLTNNTDIKAALQKAETAYNRANKLF